MLLFCHWGDPLLWFKIFVGITHERQIDDHLGNGLIASRFEKMRGNTFPKFINSLILQMFSVRKRQEESKTVTWQHAKELSLLILITNGLFPISFSQVSSCLSPTELSCSPITSPPHREAMLQCPAGCSVPVPCLSAGSSCWASRCLSDL